MTDTVLIATIFFALGLVCTASLVLATVGIKEAVAGMFRE